jgi:hypothetical protein
MNRRPRNQRKAWRRTQPSSAGYRPPWEFLLHQRENQSWKISPRTKFYLWSSAVLGCIALLLALHFLASSLTARDRREYLERLQVTYNLTDKQLTAIKSIENEFHGPGGFLVPSRNQMEKREHELAISQQMSPESAKQYLADLHSTTPKLNKRAH